MSPQEETRGGKRQKRDSIAWIIKKLSERKNYSVFGSRVLIPDKNLNEALA